MNAVPDIRETIYNATAELRRSEKGRDALFYVLAFLDDTGCSLDGAGQVAMIELLFGAWGPYAGTVREMIRLALEAFEPDYSAKRASVDFGEKAPSTGSRRMF